MACKISMSSAQTAHWLQKNAQMFIKARLNDDYDEDDDDDVSVWGKTLISQLANSFETLKCLLCDMWSFRFWFQFSALLEQQVDWAKQN